MRTQLPIVLGCALTVHRAQGLTLLGVCSDSQSLFSFGQLYTALCRVCDNSNLRVMRYLGNSAWNCARKLMEAG